MNKHLRHSLDPVIHQPVRFSIMAALSATKEAEFSFIRDMVEINDSLLSRHVTTLEKAGYIKVRKGFVGKKPRTWLSLSDCGRTAFQKHLDTLKKIADQ